MLPHRAARGVGSHVWPPPVFGAALANLHAPCDPPVGHGRLQFSVIASQRFHPKLASVSRHGKALARHLNEKSRLPFRRHREDRKIPLPKAAGIPAALP
jgi:hypothetical protein